MEQEMGWKEKLFYFGLAVLSGVLLAMGLRMSKMIHAESISDAAIFAAILVTFLCMIPFILQQRK